jgi:hypothetical protein
VAPEPGGVEGGDVPAALAFGSQFGGQRIATKVYMMAPAGRDTASIDVVDYLWEASDALVPAT